MDMTRYFKSVLEQDRAPIVLCDTENRIIYLNPAARKKYPGIEIGDDIFACHNAHSNEMIKKVVGWFGESAENNIIATYRNDRENKDVYMVALRDENGKLIGYYEKHEYRDRETAALYDFKK